jgi:hypothetical protein
VAGAAIAELVIVFVLANAIAMAPGTRVASHVCVAIF